MTDVTPASGESTCLHPSLKVPVLRRPLWYPTQGGRDVLWGRGTGGSDTRVHELRTGREGNTGPGRTLWGETVGRDPRRLLFWFREGRTPLLSHCIDGAWSGPGTPLPFESRTRSDLVPSPTGNGVPPVRRRSLLPHRPRLLPRTSPGPPSDHTAELSVFLGSTASSRPVLWCTQYHSYHRK